MSRPRKVVVCVGADEEALSCRVFLLATRGYKAVAASSAQEALAVLRILGQGLTGEVHLLLVDLPVADLDAEALREARRIHPQLRTLMLSDRSGFYDNEVGAEGFLPQGYSAAQMLERVHVLTAQRRGPKKKPVESVTAAECVEVKVG